MDILHASSYFPTSHFTEDTSYRGLLRLRIKVDLNVKITTVPTIVINEDKIR